jgi:hypothetical protein
MRLISVAPSHSRQLDGMGLGRCGGAQGNGGGEEHIDKDARRLCHELELSVCGLRSLRVGLGFRV